MPVCYINEIKKYSDVLYKTDKKYYEMKHEDFLNMSYSRCAIEELIDYILEHPEQNIIESIEVFRKTMDDYCCKACGEESKMIFSIAYDVSTNVLDYLLTLNRNVGGFGL